MQVYRPQPRFVPHLIHTVTAFILLSILAAQAIAGNASGPSAGEANSSASIAYLSNVTLHLPMGLWNRLPKAMWAPQVAPPRKKLEPKYDVSLIGQRDIGKGLDFYSLEKEINIGRQLAHEVDLSVRLVKDPVVTEYVNRLAQQLVRNSDAKVPFTVKVIDDDQINAFALPGGFFYVNTGMILAADNEAGLAGVMAHEIAHVAARHAMKNQTRADLFNILSIPLVFAGGPVGVIARQAIGVAVPMTVLKFSRDAEREADMLGLQYEYATGYDPQEFVRLFEKLKQEKDDKHNFLARAFTTHPMTGDRIKRAQKEIENHLPPREEYIVDTSEFQMVRARVAKLSDSHRIDNGQMVPILHRRGSTTQTPPKQEDDGRPTLRRRP